MRTLISFITSVFLLGVVAVPAADAYRASTFGAPLTKYEVRASVREKRATNRDARRDARQRRLQRRPSAAALPAPAQGGLVFGDADAPTTIVMFTDIECPFCQRFHQETYPDIKKKYIDTRAVRFVVRHFPLSFHPHARVAAAAVVCAREQDEDKAREFYTSLMGRSKLSESVIDDALTHVRLNLDAVDSCMDENSTQTTIDRDIADGNDAGVGGTPSFLVIGPHGTTVSVHGAYPFEHFETAIEQAQEKPSK